MPSRSSRQSTATANSAYHSLPGRPSIGRAMSSVTCLRVGAPAIHRGSVTPSGSLSMANLLEVGDVGPRAQLVEDSVRALAAHALRDRALGIVEIAKHDRVGRAHLLA